MSDEGLILSMAGDVRRIVNKVARRFVGTDDWDGCRRAVHQELEKQLSIYQGVGLALQVKRIETKVHPNGRGILVRFYDVAGNRVKL